MTHNQTLEEDIKTFANSFALSKELEDKKIVITGATGLLGSCMVRCLLSLYREKGIQLHVIAVIRDLQKAVAMFGEECKEITYYEYDSPLQSHFYHPIQLIIYSILLHLLLQKTS